MVVIVTCKNEKDPIKNEGARVVTTLFINFSDAQGQLTPKLEDLKVLRRSTDLLNNVKIDQGQLQLIMKQILFYHILGLQPFRSSDLNNPMNTPSNSPVISEEKMLRSVCGSPNEWPWIKGHRSA